MDESTIRDHRFGDCRIVLTSRELWRRDDPVPMEPRAFDPLVYLIRHRDRAVDKDELQDNIWSGTIVTEGALTRLRALARDYDFRKDANAEARNPPSPVMDHLLDSLRLADWP